MQTSTKKNVVSLKNATVSPDIWKVAIENGNYELMDMNEARGKGLYSNRPASTIDTKTGATVGAVFAFQSTQGDDHAIGEIPLNYLKAAKQDGRIVEGHVVTCTRDGTGRIRFVAVAPLEDVLEIVSKLPPSDKGHGKFWWLTALIYPKKFSY
jgi:hypothetical protein